MCWTERWFKGQRVFARCGADGNLVVNGGRVDIKYRRDAERTYAASLRNLSDKPGAARPSGGTRKSPARSHGAFPEAPKPGWCLGYADGACHGNPGPAGFGVVLRFEGGEVELAEYLGTATNNIAELTAICRAAETAKTLALPLQLFTDSKYAIGVLKQGWKAKANRELIEVTKRALAELKDWDLEHVPGHAGIQLNERADALATDAIVTRQSGRRNG